METMWNKLPCAAAIWNSRGRLDQQLHVCQMACPMDLNTPWVTRTSPVPWLLAWHLLRHRVSAKSRGLHPSVLGKLYRGALPLHAQHQFTVPNLPLLHGASTKTVSALRTCLALWAGVTWTVPPPLAPPTVTVLMTSPAPVMRHQSACCLVLK